MRNVLVSAAVLALAGPVWADTIHVPGDYSTIRAAIAASNPGDEIVVADGTWGVRQNETLTIAHALTLRSENGPGACTINRIGTQPVRLMEVRLEVGVEVRIEGFTFTEGEARQGGAVLLEGGAPVFINCVFHDNDAIDEKQPEDGRGGAVYVEWGAPTFEQCTFTSNYCEGSACSIDNGRGYGGAVYAEADTSPTFRSCSFTSNIAYGGDCSGYGFAYGGAICALSLSTLISECSFASNVANGASHGLGGAFYGSGMLDRCDFVGNRSYFSGGAVRGFNLQVFGCRFLANHTQEEGYWGDEGGWGGAIYNSSGTITISHSVFVGNEAEAFSDWYCGYGETGGPAICIGSGTATVDHCVFVANVPYCGHHGPIYVDSVAANVRVSNSAFAGHGDKGVFGDFSLGVLAIEHCITELPEPGAGNVQGVPAFVRWPSNGGDGWWNTLTNNDYGDLRPIAGSLVIDAANNALVGRDIADLDMDGDTTEPTPFDLDGNARFIDDPATADTGAGVAPIADIGPYEFVPPPCIADVNADGAVNTNDFFAYLLLYQLNDLRADLTGDTVIDPDDFAAYLAAYQLGCL